MNRFVSSFICLVFLACDSGSARVATGDAATDQHPIEGDGDAGVHAPEDLGHPCSARCEGGSDCVGLPGGGRFCAPACQTDRDCTFAGPGEGQCVLNSGAGQGRDRCAITCGAGGLCPAGFSCSDQYTPALCLPEEPEAPVDAGTDERPPQPGVGRNASFCTGSGELRNTTDTHILVDELALRMVWTEGTWEGRRQHVIRGFTRARLDEGVRLPNGQDDETMVVLTITEYPGEPLGFGMTYGWLEWMRWSGCEWYEVERGMSVEVDITGLRQPANVPENAWCDGIVTGTAVGDPGGWSNVNLALRFSAPRATERFTTGEPIEEACPCMPSCDARLCGDDGCGGSCGECGEDEFCSGAGACLCSPQCDGRSCGDNGCGGVCGTCPSTHACEDGACTCTPACDGRSCGDNGCGGTCGTCAANEQCLSGQCEVDPNFCNPVANSGCAAPNSCLLLASEDTVCALGGSGVSGSSCSGSDPCAGGYGCFGGTCRPLCRLGSSCAAGLVCTGVSGWFEYGACGTP